MAYMNGEHGILEGKTMNGLNGILEGKTPMNDITPFTNGKSETSDRVVSNGISRPEISHLTMKPDYRPRPVRAVTKFECKLRPLDEGAFVATDSVESFLDFVAADRLRRMPHRGSRWDKILRWAEHFSTQVSRYHEFVNPFVPNSQQTAKLIWASCRILIQLGPRCADALEKIIGVFYKMSLPIFSILRNGSVVSRDDATQDQFSTAYSELMTAVVEITTTYHKRISGSSSSSADDLDVRFGPRIDSFFYHRDQVSNTIWDCQLKRSMDSRSLTVSIHTLRDWLAPQDRTLRLLSSDIMNLRRTRSEYTCEWFYKDLLDFNRSSDNMFLISGSSGSGKSMLSGWINERLERSFDGKSCVVISLIIDATLRSAITPTNAIKHLILQALDQNVGSVSFYKSLSMAYELSIRTRNAVEIEDALWRAFGDSLDIDDRVMIIVDGLDQLVGGEAASMRVLHRLHGISTSHLSTKCIVLSQPLSNPFPGPTRRFSIEPKHVHHDLHCFVRQSLAAHHQFCNRKEEERRTMIQRIVDAVNGSFELADLTVRLSFKEETYDGFTHFLDNIPKSVSEVIRTLTSQFIGSMTTETKLILSWLLVTERPLTLRETQSLLEIDIKINKRGSRTINVKDLIDRSCGYVVEVRDGILRFRHSSIQQHFAELAKTGKHLLSLEDAHRDLACRCLAYANIHLSSSTDCRLKPLETSEIEVLFQKHPLLQYTIRYWTSHFCASPMYRPNGKHEFSPEFHGAFCGSVLLPQLEWACWENQSSISEAVEMHQVALSVRKMVLTETHEAVLQSLITIASTFEKTSDVIEASAYYYEASKLSQVITGSHSEVTRTCAETFLKCTESTTITTRTEVATRKEEILKVIITAHEHQSSSSSKEVIHYKKLLAQMYTDIRETTRAVEVYREVHEACVAVYGEFHAETAVVSRGLTVVLQRESRQEEVSILVRSSFKIAEETMEVTDVRRITITLRLVAIQETCNELIEAEELLITLWRRVAIACHTGRSVEIHGRKIEIALAYVSFLRRHSRYQEAENILRGLWIEYECEHIESESLVIWIQKIGEELVELRVLDIAIEVFTTVWSFYKRIRKECCVEAVSVAITLAKITVEVRSEESFTKEITYTEETIFKEIYESTIKTITTNKLEISTVQTCETLSTFYVQTERWSEALSVCYEVLRGLWVSIVTEHGQICLPDEFTSEAIDIAIRTAHCHTHERQTQKAESLLLYIFKATKLSLRIQDDLVYRSASELITFYETCGRPDQAIEVYRELWVGYSCTLGKTHSRTLEVLYRLGELTVRHGRKGAESYYLEIYLNLDRHSDICHHDSMDAAFALVKIYESERRWTDAQKIYGCLWRTILKRTKEYCISAERVEEIYRCYFHLLEVEVKVSYTILRQTTIEFREICGTAYGHESEITIKATLRLAEISERSEKHVHEAIQIYEEVCRETQSTTEKTTTVSTTITEARTRLSRLYVKQSSSSVEYTSKAITLHMEQFEITKAQYGCSHEITITQLEELATYYKSRKEQKLITIVLRVLQGAIVEIITRETDSRRLFDSSVRIAKIYVTHGFTKEAFELLTELRCQIVSKDVRSGSTFEFRVDQHVDRRSFVFLARFEETLKGTKTDGFSESMADYLTENLMLDAYAQALTQKTRFETTMLCGARLRYFRRSRYHDARDSRIENELFESFLRTMGSSIRTSKTTTRTFFGILLEETGKSQHEIQLVKAGSNSGTAAVRVYLEQCKFQEAFELATCVWQFTSSQQGFNDQEVISSGFKIALYLAGRNAKRCEENSQLRRQMMGLSREFVQEILRASRHINVDFTKTPISELNELVSLMGEQQNFSDLEWLLTQLWESRHSQITWSSTTVIQIGRRLVEVRFSHGDRDAAIRLLEDICYNLRRVWGSLDQTTLQMSTLLSELYTTAGRYAQAMGLHEEILRREISDDNDATVEDASRDARVHLELLKRAHQRLGGWVKDRDEYVDLVDEVLSTFQVEGLLKDALPITKWPAKCTDDRGGFKPPTAWDIIVGDEERKHQNWLRRQTGVQRYDTELARKGVKRAVSALHIFTEGQNV